MAYFTVIPLNLSVENICLDILSDHPLKTLDSIQLASACVVKSKTDALVLADKKLDKTAKELNINTIHVLNS